MPWRRPKVLRDWMNSRRMRLNLSFYLSGQP